MRLALVLLSWMLPPVLPVQAANWITAQSDHFSIVSDAPRARVSEAKRQEDPTK